MTRPRSDILTYGSAKEQDVVNRYNPRPQSVPATTKNASTVNALTDATDAIANQGDTYASHILGDSTSTPTPKTTETPTPSVSTGGGGGASPSPHSVAQSLLVSSMQGKSLDPNLLGVTGGNWQQYLRPGDVELAQSSIMDMLSKAYGAGNVLYINGQFLFPGSVNPSGT